MQDIERGELQLGFHRYSPWKHLDFTTGQGGLCIQASYAGSVINKMYSVSCYVYVNL